MTNSNERIVATSRKSEALNAFLDTLIEKGLTDTSVRDLSASINLQSAGMYYYFQTKEELIVACAEEAILRLESELIRPTLFEASKPEKMLDNLKSRLDLMAPTMKFFTQVRSTPKYEKLLHPSLERLNKRYEAYSDKLGKKLGCSFEIASDIFYRCIMASTQYMVYGDNQYIETQMNLIKTDISSIKTDMSSVV